MLYEIFINQAEFFASWDKFVADILAEQERVRQEQAEYHPNLDIFESE